jgi:hypothetical protein
MGDRTAIEWTDATWNPMTGCSKLTAGCDHCYAAKDTPVNREDPFAPGSGPSAWTCRFAGVSRGGSL